jgi:hypothetical protein
MGNPAHLPLASTLRTQGFKTIDADGHRKHQAVVIIIDS